MDHVSRRHDKPIALRVASWAFRIACRVPRLRLAALASRVGDRLRRQPVYRWAPPDPENANECAEFAAFGLATLRWIHREQAGRAPVPRYTQAEAIAWLARKRGGVIQLTIWDWG